ncbi:MAG: RluA family pseudouridine synthase [Alphaproteobacteria bacterium]|nr:RluA family pseudouridine synthase [Alphaproteobacteria bacterium]
MGVRQQEYDLKDQKKYFISVSQDKIGIRLDRYIAETLENISRSRAKTLIEQGFVQLTDTILITDPAYKIKLGQNFAIILPDPISAVPLPQAIILSVVYEDEDLIVINKPAGMVVHPGPGNMENTMVNALIAHCGQSLSGIGGVQRPGIVHRLDKDTSGLIVAAKNDFTHQKLSSYFADRSIERLYTALVWGVPQPLQGQIEGNIGRNPVNRKNMSVLKKHGKPALTYYKVVKNFGLAASIIECKLASGRTHQIRVHLNHKGHSVIGDPVYGKATSHRLAAVNIQARDYISNFKRQALHAKTLGFIHPRTNKELHFDSELPDDMRQLINLLDGK